MENIIERARFKELFQKTIFEGNLRLRGSG